MHETTGLINVPLVTATIVAQSLPIVTTGCTTAVVMCDAPPTLPCYQHNLLVNALSEPSSEELKEELKISAFVLSPSDGHASNLIFSPRDGRLSGLMFSPQDGKFGNLVFSPRELESLSSVRTQFSGQFSESPNTMTRASGQLEGLMPPPPAPTCHASPFQVVAMHKIVERAGSLAMQGSSASCLASPIKLEESGSWLDSLVTPRTRSIVAFIDGSLPHEGLAATYYHGQGEDQQQ